MPGSTVGAGLAYQPLAADALAERWRRLLVEPGVPDFCELDEYGDVIEVNPPSRPHQRIVWSIQRQIAEKLGGEALPGVGVLTRIGVHIPDVIWEERRAEGDPTSPAPTICVEVQSEYNTRRELDEKLAAYLAAGAKEVILVELSGRIRYFGAQGERGASAFGLALALPADTYPR
jgi:Uma2 family endonuclease